jgi:hypothetical protein
MKKTLLTERFQELAGIKPLYEQPDDLEQLGSTMAKGFDDRLAQQMGMSNDEFEDQVASRDVGDQTFGSAGTDKRRGQVMGEIFDLIRKHTLDPEEVMEEVATEFDIPFEFGRASGFKQAGTDAGFDMRGL